MISPAKLDKLPTEVVSLVQELQEEIISDICRRISKVNYLTPTAEWELYKANQLNLSYKEVNRRIARQLKVRERTVQELYSDTVKQALKEDADIYRIAAAMGKLPDSTGAKTDKYFRSASFSQLLSKGLQNSKGQMRNLCNSMAAEANRQLSDAMDLAHLKVISGAFSYNDAIYSAVRSLADKGIARVEYPSGRRDNADVCVRRAVLSSVNKSCCDIQLDLAKEIGSRYVEVSSHFGARPSHAEWQGQIYSLVRGDPKYPYFYDATGYGTGEGLGGWNCRHNFFPYFEGIDTPYHTPDFTKNENDEYYALTQKQRGYERAVRDSKRQLAGLTVQGSRRRILSSERDLTAILHGGRLSSKTVKHGLMRLSVTMTCKGIIHGSGSLGSERVFRRGHGMPQRATLLLSPCILTYIKTLRLNPRSILTARNTKTSLSNSVRTFSVVLPVILCTFPPEKP
nr:MAG TPA: minor capsid protein [Caudoviricetes sp.]